MMFTCFLPGISQPPHSSGQTLSTARSISCSFQRIRFPSSRKTMGAGIPINRLFKGRQEVFLTHKVFVLDFFIVEVARPDLMDDILFPLNLQWEVIHPACDLPNLFEPEFLDSHNTVIRHRISENQIVGIEHPGFCFNLVLIHGEIGDIKSWVGIIVETLHLQQGPCFIICVEVKIWRHLGVGVRKKFNLFFSKPFSDPFLYDVSHDIPIFYCKADGPHLEADKPFRFFYLFSFFQLFEYLFACHFH